MYNVLDSNIPNLESFLSNGGAIGVMGPHALMVTEIMWGSDASLKDPGGSQWIELYNAGAEYKTQDGTNTTYLIFYGPGEAPQQDFMTLSARWIQPLAIGRSQVKVKVVGRVKTNNQKSLLRSVQPLRLSLCIE